MTGRSPPSRRGRWRISAGSSRRSRPGSRRRSTAACCPGRIRFPNIYCQVKGVYTNTGMVDAYRGAGRPEATYLVERAIDLVARELDLDPVEVRRKNFIPADAFPYEPAGNLLNGLAYDSGEYEKTLGRALEIVDYDGFRAKQADARKQGRYLGIGFSTYVEICGVAPSAWIGTVGEGWGAAMWESANVRVHLTGKVVVTIGTASHGQGHETTVAQIVADELGIPIEDVTVQLGDTLGTPFGYGTYGSRSAAVARHRGLQQPPEDQGEGPSDRGAHARGDVTRTSSTSTARSRQGRARPCQDDPGDRRCRRPRLRPPRGRGALPRRHHLLRPAELHVPVRHAHRHRRGRRRDRGGQARPLRRGRRRRPGDQPDDRRRPGARRHRAGRRAGAVGGRRLRRERPAAHGQHDGLRGSEGATSSRRSRSSGP